MIEGRARPLIAFGIIVLNGEPFVRYNLRSLYPYAHQIVVVEGAAPAAATQATPDGHSADGTLETIRAFIAEEDPEGKVTLVTAEDEGHTDGFWSEKDEMSAAYATRATGEYLWQVDIDEFYLPEDMSEVIRLLRTSPPVGAVTFRTLTFWGGPGYRTDGLYLRKGADEVRRVFAWGPGHRYVTHRPPTVVDERGTPVHTRNAVSARDLERRGVYLYHYELLFPRQVERKCSYYASVPWTDTLRSSSSWADECYLTLGNPFRVHMVYDHVSWLERYRGPHPPQVMAMMRDVAAGRFPGITPRGTADVERLLARPTYRLQVAALKTALFSSRVLWPRIRLVRSWVMASPAAPMLRRLKLVASDLRRRGEGQQVSGGYRRIDPAAITAEMLGAWRSPEIVDRQRALVDEELARMYVGDVIPPYRALADAVVATGARDGLVLEVGCASGYYYEVLAHLVPFAIDYRGLDYSPALISEARRRYPEVPFDVGDATDLPYDDASFDIVISGCVILHLREWRRAIAESARVSRGWVILHRTPLASGPTEYYSKLAYGQECLELHFGREALIGALRQNGLTVVRELAVAEGVVTFVCRKG